MRRPTRPRIALAAAETAEPIRVPIVRPPPIRHWLQSPSPWCDPPRIGFVSAASAAAVRTISRKPSVTRFDSSSTGKLGLRRDRPRANRPRDNPASVASPPALRDRAESAVIQSKHSARLFSLACDPNCSLSCSRKFACRRAPSSSSRSSRISGQGVLPRSRTERPVATTACHRGSSNVASVRDARIVVRTNRQRQLKTDARIWIVGHLEQIVPKRR